LPVTLLNPSQALLSPTPSANGNGRHPTSVPLLVKSPCASTAPQPIAVGVPFPKGLLADPEAVCLRDPDGRLVPLQRLPLARWSDRSVKWLLLDFLLPGTSEGSAVWSLDLITTASQPEIAALRVTELANAIAIDTGAASFQVDRTALQPFASVKVNEADLLDASRTRVVLTNANGKQTIGKVERVTLESRGPLHATVHLEGRFPGRVRMRFVARLGFYAGTGLVRLALTVHNPNRARHAGGLWDLGDPGSMLFRDLTLELGLAEAKRLTWTTAVGQAPRATRPAGWELYQDSSGGDNWNSRNHVNREGRVPCSFRGYRLRTAEGEELGRRASPVVSLSGPHGGLTASLPEFWQQFPKALEAEDGLLRVRLFPGQLADLHELQGGEQKTHVVWLAFGPEGRNPSALDWVHQPARVQVPPEWSAASHALPHFLPVSDGARTPLDELLAEAVTGASSHFARREIIDEYGWRPYGDLYADHEAAYYKGPAPIVSHYNNQYDVIYGAILQYLRTGESRWFDLLDPLARHVMDVDVYHTTKDRAAYNGGLFWHTDHYHDAATATHRAYSRANQSNGQPYGGGPCNEHNYTTGLLHYYYLTGDPNARETVLSLADWVVQMDDGFRTIFGLIDDGPTGTASCTNGRDYHGPGRGCGNSVNALLDGWLASGWRGYLDKAEELIRRVIHPDDDVAARDPLNLELRWSYTVFLSALARYLDLKAEVGELDGSHAYARASLLRWAGWMTEHEQPYFDHPEKMDYPTETWAAQDFRKANVLRLAAAHADEPLRARLLQRGDELAERAWIDLLRFPSRSVARSLAILQVEGSRDDYFRSRGVAAAPRAAGTFDFGQPPAFVSQRQRVQAMLKSPGGLVRALIRLANPLRWRRWLSPGSHPTSPEGGKPW
jgi:hypothetical protein